MSQQPAITIDIQAAAAEIEATGTLAWHSFVARYPNAPILSKATFMLAFAPGFAAGTDWLAAEVTKELEQ